MTGYVTRHIVINYTKIPMLNGFYFFLFCSVIIFAAIFGDFFESFLKRCANSKDSGKLLPGHGGLMDRIDSLSLCFPLGYYFLTNFI